MAWSIWASASESNVNYGSNCSDVTVTINISWDWGSYARDNPGFGISIGGNDFTGTANFNAGEASSGSQSVVSRTATIYHNEDGSKSVGYSIWYDGSGSGRKYASGSLTLTTIPRASSITSASSVELGNTCSIKWTPKSSSHKYKLAFSLSSWNYTTGYISPSSTSQYTYTGYTIPLAVANQLPTTTSGSMSVSLYTYNSSNGQVGSPSSSSFTVTIPSSVKPTISSCTVSRVTGDNTTTDSWGVYVQNISRAKFTASATQAYGSAIQSFTISGGYSKTVTGSSLNHTSSVFGTYGSNITFSVVAVDARGRSSSAYSLGPITVYQYSAPSFSNASVQRGSAPNTTNAVLYAIWSYSTVNGNNSCTCQFKYKKRTDSGYSTYASNISNNTITTISGILDETSSYDCKFILSDTLGNTAEITASTSTTAATMDFKGGGLGIAIGKMSEENSLFEVDWDSKFNNDVYIDGDAEIAGKLSAPSNNNFISNANEFNFVPNGYSGGLYFNYRTFGGTNGNISDYIFGNGAGGQLGTALHTGNISTYSNNFVYLWKTGSETTSIGETTANITLTNYEAVLAVFRCNTSDCDFYDYVIGYKNKNNLATITISTDGGQYTFYRTFIVSDGGVTFSSCMSAKYTGYSGGNNSYMIPVAVYGITNIVIGSW